MRLASNGFHGGLFKNNKLKKKEKKAALRPCVSLSWFKKIEGFHSVRRSREPTSNEWLLLPLLVECYKSLMLTMFDEPLVQVVMDIKDFFLFN